ncbi:MAG: hypothetical protein K6F23_02820 [Solobacterium sp.]|nr:hypothetical protein [Solobacterium sp.]
MTYLLKQVIKKKDPKEPGRDSRKKKQSQVKEETKIIQSSNVWICGQFMSAQVEISGSKITDIRDIGEKEPDEDYGDLRIVPGFIDIQWISMLRSEPA